MTSVMALSACTPAVAAVSPAAAAVPASTGAGGPGSITVTITAPRPVSGHVQTQVTCVPGRVYRAYAAGVLDGYTVRYTATATRYTGPASYPTTLTGSISAPGGEAFALAAVRTSATITATGGSVPFTATSPAGHTLAGSLAWTCS